MLIVDFHIAAAGLAYKVLEFQIMEILQVRSAARTETGIIRDQLVTYRALHLSPPK